MYGTKPGCPCHDRCFWGVLLCVQKVTSSLAPSDMDGQIPVSMSEITDATCGVL